MPVTDVPSFPPFERRLDAEERIRSALNAVRAILIADLMPVHRSELLTVCLWKLSEAEGTGKYKTRFISLASLGRPFADLAHEHVNERAKLVRDLVSGRIDVESLPQQCIGCTVLRSEHKALGDVPKHIDGWQRYRHARIAVIDRVRGSWCVPP